jgi:uncharacterized protein
VLLTLVALGALVLALFWAGQRRLIYLPFGEVPPPAAVGLPRAEPVSFAAEDGVTLRGWFVPGSGPAPKATVIVFNGNAGNRAFRAPLAARLAERGVQSLLFDYRGYGDSPGSPSEEGLARDARAARRYLAERGDVDQNRVVYFGESLGTGVAVRLATEEPPSALVLRSAYTSLVDVGRHHYPFLPVRWLLRDRFPSLERVAGLRMPVLVIAADHDTIVPTAQSERLYAAITGPKRLVIIDNADHNDYELLAGDRVIEAIVSFCK